MLHCFHDGWTSEPVIGLLNISPPPLFHPSSRLYFSSSSASVPKCANIVCALSSSFFYYRCSFPHGRPLIVPSCILFLLFPPAAAVRRQEIRQKPCPCQSIFLFPPPPLKRGSSSLFCTVFSLREGEGRKAKKSFGVYAQCANGPWAKSLSSPSLSPVLAGFACSDVFLLIVLHRYNNTACKKRAWFISSFSVCAERVWKFCSEHSGKWEAWQKSTLCQFPVFFRCQWLSLPLTENLLPSKSRFRRRRGAEVGEQTIYIVVCPWKRQQTFLFTRTPVIWDPRIALLGKGNPYSGKLETLMRIQQGNRGQLSCPVIWHDWDRPITPCYHSRTGVEIPWFI